MSLLLSSDGASSHPARGVNEQVVSSPSLHTCVQICVCRCVCELERQGSVAEEVPVSDSVPEVLGMT